MVEIIVQICKEVYRADTVNRYYLLADSSVSRGNCMEERINELELRYMQQEHTIQELNDIVCHQELVLEQLRRDFATMKEQMMAMSPSASGDTSQEEPPPHY
jgi:SlyX protein